MKALAVTEWVLPATQTPAWVSGGSQLAVVDALNVAFLLLLLVCGLTDLFRQRIFNMVTYPTMLTGVALHTAGSGWKGLQTSLVGLVVGFTLFFIVFLFGGLGGGDVKFMAAIGALQGYPFVLYASAFSAVFGLVLALAELVARGRLFQSLRTVFGVFLSWLIPFMAKRQLDPRDSAPIPYGYGMALGALWAWVLWTAGVMRA